MKWKKSFGSKTQYQQIIIACQS